MSRAEQRALEAFPESYSGHNEYDRKCFVYGYEQAEKDCREEIASIKAKLWQEGYNEGYKRAKSENVLDWEDEVVVDEDGFPCIKTLNFHDDDEDEPLFKPGDKVEITVRKKQSEN